MNEALFGAGTQLWPTMPLTGFTYFQAPPGTRALGGSPVIAGGAPAPDPAQLSAASMLVAPDFAVSIPPQALLTAVAIRRGQPMGPSNDQEIEDFISDALDLLPGASDVEVRCEGGRIALTGNVSHKRLKRDVGEIAWAIPAVHDVQNTVTIATRRRSRPPGRESEAAAAAGGGRKS